MNLLSMTRLISAGALSGAMSTCAAAPAADLTVFNGQPGAHWRVLVADPQGRVAYQGQAVQVPKGATAQQPASVVGARPARRQARGGVDGGAGADAGAGAPGEADAVSLHFRDTWYAALRFESPVPLDLGPWLARGQLVLDIQVAEMAQGGLHIGLSCGEHCGRRLNQVLPSRALAGRGWQTLAFPLHCFVRQGDDWRGATPAVTLDGNGAGEVAVARVRLSAAPVPGLAAQPCISAEAQTVTPEPLNQAWSLGWWLPRHQQKLAEARAMLAAGRGPQLVMIGDSITQSWEDTGRGPWNRHLAPLGALNLGFGGDKTENVLWRLQNGALDGLNPRVVTLLIGTNNTGDRMDHAAATAAGVARVLQEIRQRLPAARVLLLAILPREARPDAAMRQRNEQINALIERLADGRQVHFLNVNSALTNPDGTLSTELLPDLLHLSERGYALWAERLLPVLRTLMAP
ncbi:GDSL-type esterase/lipase family protein [Aquabacterium sp. OR-4]|uniref:GDSL-type esterase/lipase family protein n=1 Tax=Aquabacterium sp. OR-4 TaxID=2978127 RepID=UPI0028C7B568|nr:GDSL-type esterase/lipase family protein [Aquabacterium sp. OR-4]MDT7838357.1 GDSL-type esterase/lipase family protein [Aquabacterium sp. OR-4]